MAKVKSTTKKNTKLVKCALEGCNEMFEPRNYWHRTHHWKCSMKYHAQVLEKRKQNEISESR